MSVVYRCSLVVERCQACVLLACVHRFTSRVQCHVQPHCTLVLCRQQNSQKSAVSLLTLVRFKFAGHISLKYVRQKCVSRQNAESIVFVGCCCCIVVVLS
ncbi:unnamed protein product [Polarella glacialis]|uniref:Uncharacterized protein n=1 Tax=Polarella glacialis TaxID=89957 RepID=A0A813KGQ4_POLGL|nr:unnamed protein product [Polarella glacialis]CAE8700191.1 unnamed protein product [Polarella glacialis]